MMRASNPPVVQLRELTTLISSGVTPKGGSEVYLKSGPVMLVRSQNVRMNALSLSDVAYITDDIDADMERTRVSWGDVLLNITGASIGRVAPFELRERANVNQHVCIIRPNHEKLFHQYLAHLIASPKFQAVIDQMQHGGTRQALTFGQIASFEIPLPPLAEQRRIAAILDAADALRQKRRQALRLLDQLPQAIFVEMFGDPGSNMMAWPKASLDDLTEASDRINYGVVQPGDDVEDGVPLIRVADLLMQGEVRAHGLKRILPSIESNYSRSRLKGDEILIACVGSVGAVALATPDVAGANIARAVARVRVADQKALRRFVAEQLRSDAIQRYFQSEIRVVAQPTLNIKQIKETPIVVPPLCDQQNYCERVARVDEMIAAARSSLMALERLFASLQHRAFRGEL